MKRSELIDLLRRKTPIPADYVDDMADFIQLRFGTPTELNLPQTCDGCWVESKSYLKDKSPCMTCFQTANPNGTFNKIEDD